MRKGEGSENKTNENVDPNTELAYAVNLVFSKQASKRQAINNQKLINIINDPKELNKIRPYLLDLALKILTDQDLDIAPLTSQE